MLGCLHDTHHMVWHGQQALPPPADATIADGGRSHPCTRTDYWQPLKLSGMSAISAGRRFTEQERVRRDLTAGREERREAYRKGRLLKWKCTKLGWGRTSISSLNLRSAVPRPPSCYSKLFART